MLDDHRIDALKNREVASGRHIMLREVSYATLSRDESLKAMPQLVCDNTFVTISPSDDK